MSGKMKKLICAILSGTMILSSASMLAFAADPDQPDTDGAEVTETAAPAGDATEAPADETDAPAADATEAPSEATEAPAATEAPVTSTKYDSDEYYKKALSLCKGLGIITGREDGNVDPEANVTRAEMAAIILRMLNNTTTSSYRDAFTDVTSSHWAASVIQTASALGIINGYPEDKSFRPDNSVQYEQVAKMIVCAMNYNETAEYYGGYPNGHLKVASDLNITKNAPGNTGVASERGVVIKMIYNALLADYNEPSGVEYGQQQYKADKTLAEYAFDVKEAKGVLLGTEITSLTGSKYNKGQVRIRINKSGNESEDETFLTDLTGLEDVLASNITFYYEEQPGNAEKRLLAVVENTAKTQTENIDRKDVENLDEFEGFDDEASQGSIKLHGKSAFKIAANPIIIYNGSLVTLDTFTAAQTNAKEDDTRFYKNIEKGADNKVTSSDRKTFTEFLKPEVGTIRIVDNDTDGVYDIVFVDSYETMVVTSASTKSVIGKINNQSTSINVNEDENDLTIKTTISGMEAAPRNLKKNSVVSIKRSFDGETLEFTSTGESFTGSIQSISEDEDGMVITVAGEEYDVDANAVADCKTGVQAIFYTDAFGRVGYVEASTSGMLQSGEKYGWIMAMYNSVNGEDTVVNLYTQEGKSVELTLADRVDFWGKDDTASTSMKASDVKAALTSGTGDSISIKDSAFLYMSNKTTPIRLIKYRSNANNEISRIYCAIDAAKSTEAIRKAGALIINPSNLNGVAARSGSVSGYTIADGIVEFSAPLQIADMKSASNYEIGEAVSSNYIVRENGSSRDYVIGEFDGIAANIVIKFTSSADGKASYTEMGTAEGGPSIMVVEKVAEGYDSDNEVPIYSISGYTGGSATTVKTNKNTVVGNAQKTLTIRENNQQYFAGFKKGEELWNAPEAATGTFPIRKGDIIVYTGDGRVILRYASAADAKFDEEGNFIESSIPVINGDGVPGSSTRVAFYFGQVQDSGLEDAAYVKMTNCNENITFSPDIKIDVVTISSNGNVKLEKDAIYSSDLEIGDYLMIYLVEKRTTVKSMMVYRFED